MDHKYKLKYDVNTDAGEFSGEEIKKEGKGGTDCLLLGSMIHGEDGSYSQTYLTVDGRNEGKSLSANDEFKFWIMMAKSISEKPDLSSGKKAFVTDVFETFRLALIGGGPAAEGEYNGQIH